MKTVAEHSTENQIQTGEVPKISLRNPVPADEDMFAEDTVLWVEDVYEGNSGVTDDAEAPPRWRWTGRRTVKAVVECGFSIGPAATWLVHFRVLASTGHEALRVGMRVPRTVSKLKRYKVLREAWVCDAERARARRRAMSDAKMPDFRVRQVDHIVGAERSRLTDCTGNTLSKSVRKLNSKNKRAKNKSTKNRNANKDKSKNTMKGKAKKNVRKGRKSGSTQPGR